MSYPLLRKSDVFLAPGELHCSFAPSRVWTILGSCVSVVIWHPRLRFGAMSHYLLPSNPQQDAKAGARDPRYGVDSCALILKALNRAGVAPEQCEAHLFGGSQLIANRAKSAIGEIGQRNAIVAREFLKQNRIKLIDESLFGAGHRRICFDVESGKVWEKVGGEDASVTRTHRKLRALK